MALYATALLAYRPIRPVPVIVFHFLNLFLNFGSILTKERCQNMNFVFLISLVGIRDDDDAVNLIFPVLNVFVFVV